MMMTESRERSMAWKQTRALLDPLGWMAASRRYRSGFCAKGAGDFIPGVVATGSNTQHDDDGKSRTIDGLETNARFARPTWLDGCIPSLPLRVLYQRRW